LYSFQIQSGANILISNKVGVIFDKVCILSSIKRISSAAVLAFCVLSQLYYARKKH